MNNILFKNNNPFVKISKEITNELYQDPRLIITLAYLFKRKGLDDTILMSINHLVKDCGLKPIRNADGNLELFKKTIFNLIEMNIITFVDEDINQQAHQQQTKLYNSIKPTDIIELKFINSEYFSNIKNNFTILEYSTINKLKEYCMSPITSAKTNLVTLINVYMFIKIHIFFSKDKEYNYCGLSINTISKKLNLATKTVVKIIKILEDLEVLYVYRFLNYQDDDNGENNKCAKNKVTSKKGFPTKRFNNLYSIEKYSKDVIEKDTGFKIV